ncbi:hypothetical protein ACOSQ2_005562 [Xanthoceras sorbifolium]
MAFSPEESVEFVYANTQNFIRSTEGLGPEKLSNDDWMQTAAFHTWTAFGSLRDLEAKLLQAREHLKDLKSTLVHQKDLKIAQQARLEEVCAESNSLRLENAGLLKMLQASEAEVEALRNATAKGAKAEKYKQWAMAARGMIRRLKKELSERAID